MSTFSFIPWNNTEIQTNYFLLHSNKIVITVSPHKLILLPVVHISSWLSLQKFDPLFIEHFQKHVNISQHFSILVYSAPCLFSPPQFSLWKEIFCISKFFSFVLSLLQLSFCWKTQIMIFVLLKVNRHFSIIISLGRHFLATALMDSPSFSKLHFPALSGHQSILICHVPLWTAFEVSLILFPTGLHISIWVPWRFSLVSILWWSLLWVCVLVKLHLF